MKSCLTVIVLLLFIVQSRPHSQAQSTDGMVPFAMDHRGAILSHSPLDVSFLLDAPAGKHGFIQVTNVSVRATPWLTGSGRRDRLVCHLGG